MARFRYVAKDSKGGTIRAVDDAASARAMAANLRRRGLVMVSAEETGSGPKLANKADPKTRQRSRVKVGEIADFFSPDGDLDRCGDATGTNAENPCGTGRKQSSKGSAWRD